MTEQGMVDLDNRDPNNLNQHCKTEFEDIFGEPDGTKSADCVWVNSAKCFTCGKNCCYKFLTYLCGIFVALAWGCEFAVITFDQVWFSTPCYRAFSIYALCCQKCIGTCLGCYLGPCCETLGLMFSKIKVEKA